MAQAASMLPGIAKEREFIGDRGVALDVRKNAGLDSHV
jgi:hypothetical protein